MPDFLTQIPLAFAAGLISVLSPCVMPLMPAYLSLISGVSVEGLSQAEPDPNQRARVMNACLGFVSGFSTIFIILGASAFGLGRVLRGWHFSLLGFDVGLAQLAGLIIIIFGLHLTGVVQIGWLLRDTRVDVEMKSPGFGGSYLVGAGFGFGWSPCIGPILGTVLTLASARETLGQGVVLLAVYSLGLAIPFLLAGWSIDSFFRAFSRIKRHFRALEIGSGVLLMAVGVLIATNQLAWFNAHFAFLAEWVVVAEEALQ